MVSRKEDLEKVVNDEFAKTVAEQASGSPSIEDITVNYLRELAKLLAQGQNPPEGVWVRHSTDSQGGVHLVKVKIKCELFANS